MIGSIEGIRFFSANKHVSRWLATGTSGVIGSFVGSARTIYIRFMYGISGRKIATYTAIYGVYIRFWPTLLICLVPLSAVNYFA